MEEDKKIELEINDTTTPSDSSNEKPDTEIINSEIERKEKSNTEAEASPIKERNLETNEIPLEVKEEIPPIKIAAAPAEVKPEASPLETKLEVLESQLAKLGKAFDVKLKYDKHKDKIIDKLHTELQTYKNDVVHKAVKPFVKDLIRLADDVRKMHQSYLKKEKDSLLIDKLLNNYLEFGDDIDDILYRYGIEEYTEEDDTFNPSRQKAIKIIPTNQADLNGKIKDRLKKGYEWEGKTFRLEQVSVYKYKKSEE